MVALEFRHVTKHYGGVGKGSWNVAVDDLSFVVPPGEICVLAGPSGCGKSTTLKMVNRLVELFGCERIRTIGDAYMAVCGLPEPTPEHAHNVARVALRMLRYVERRNAAHAEAWQCRIGIHSGPVIGSIVGIQKYVYDIFGPGVNMAARMEAISEPMRITVSEETYDLIKEDFVCSERGEFEVKGFGTKTVYFLERERPQGR